MIKFRRFLPLKETLVATFSEACALTTRRYVSGPGMSILNSSKKLKLFWSHSSVFAFENYPKNAKFSEFLPLKKPSSTTFSDRVHSLPENMYLKQA